MSPASQSQVHERRTNRQIELLNCAVSIARSKGLHHVTIGAVARCSGMGRSTVYSYFPSASHLIGEVVIDEMLDMVSAISQELRTARNPRQAVTLWIRATLNYIAEGGHQLIREAASVELNDSQRHRISVLHRQLSAPLTDALVSLNCAEPQRAALQIHSLVEACVRRIESGHNPVIEISSTENFILRGLGLD